MFVLVSIVLSFFIQLAAVVLLESFRNVWSGPYAIIFACLIQYVFDVPSMTKFKVFGLNVTEKHVVYLLCLQLLLANFPNSLIAGVSGLIAGFFYRSQALHLKTIFFPDRVVEFCIRYLDPIISSSAPPITSIPLRGAIANNLRTRISRNPQRGLNQQQEEDQPQTLMPQTNVNYEQFNMLQQHLHNQFARQEQQIINEENVQSLRGMLLFVVGKLQSLEMGFNDDVARRALIAANNDVNIATELLITGEVE